MRITAEVWPSRRVQDIDLAPGARGFDLLDALHLAPDAHLLVRGETPIPLDDVLVDGERVRVLAVVSGG